LIKLALTENMFYLKKLVPNFQSRDAYLIGIAVDTISNNNNNSVGISDFG
jgi:alkyl hydroperoxide reductase subunit AhpC